MAAILLRLPSVVRSEQYAYVNPQSHVAYINHVQTQRDSDRILDHLIQLKNDERDAGKGEGDSKYDSFFTWDGGYPLECSAHNVAPTPRRTAVKEARTILYELRYMQKLSLPKTDTSEAKRFVVPQCSMYANRGHSLAHLNRLEYASIIRTAKETPEDPLRMKQYRFGDDYELRGFFSQVIMAKHKTPLVIRKPPRHPGKRPTVNSKQHRPWQEAADKYAEYFLTLFRPEPDCHAANHINNYRYTWEALEEFVSQLQHDNSILSKFRLMSMHTRMKGYLTSYRHKVILTSYRLRERDLWSHRQVQIWAQKAEWEQREAKLDKELSELQFNIIHKDLSQRRNHLLKKCLNTADRLTTAFRITFGTPAGTSNPTFPTELKQQIRVSDEDSAADIQFKARGIHRFNKEGSPTTFDDDTPENCYTHSEDKLKRQHEETVRKFKSRQKEVYDMYKKYLDDPSDSANHPPDIVILHGGAGTGKSTLLNAILNLARFKGKTTLRTAFNCINALHINGETTSSVVDLKGEDTYRINELGHKQIQHFSGLASTASLVVVDEISTQAPWHLAKLAKACRQMTRNHDKPFGGIPIILCGDLMQLEPVKAGKSFPAAIIDMCKNKWCQPNDEHKRHMANKKKQQRADKKTKMTDVNNDDNFDKYDAKHHPYAFGSSIIRSAYMVELDEQVRTDDPDHAAFVTKLYNCKNPSMRELQQIQVLSHTDYADPSSPWFQAPIIVLTHRERYNLIHETAVRFATAAGQPVIRWMVKKPSGWRQKPPPTCFNKFLITIRAFTSTSYLELTPT